MPSNDMPNGMFSYVSLMLKKPCHVGVPHIGHQHTLDASGTRIGHAMWHFLQHLLFKN